MKVKQAAPKKRPPSRLLPVMGVALALIFALFAYVLIDPTWNFLRDRGVQFGGLADNVIQLLIGFMIWIVFFGISMLVVAIIAGRNPEEKDTLRFYKEQERRRKAMQQKKGKRR
ncbi:MAG: hypothetical protein JW910_02210 [Anaerolineae bacterium]|nr:hypothetical protein [Anaerolineae bacterium]